MATAAHILGLVLLFATCLVAIASLVIGLPGTLLIVAVAIVYGWATGFASMTWGTIGWLVALAAIGEGLELLSSVGGAARTRPSTRVAVATLAGAVVGGIVGTPFLFGIGSLLGALAGAFAGATLASAAEGSATTDAVSVGLAAMRGRLLGFVAKLAIATVMLILVAAAVL